ncbi:hypothetical protein B296_00055166 [Ensete ventricosum]|uniref:Uncharacterized protein n=1 Tax=Ensete ventricosum TaxID=4639 RepID=A0A426Y1F6_ENSVE|nr:hypothetical protein B296_00055166 [Ensete ventricosum]
MIDSSFSDSNGLTEPVTGKRLIFVTTKLYCSKRSETCSTPAKACREKLRRDRLNDRCDIEFIMGEPAAEKNELRDEKQKLKAENESLEQQIKLRSSYVSHPPPVIATPFTAKGQAAAQKLMIPIIGYPGFPMWQFMAPSDIDTSQDADKYPPAA